MSNRLKHIFEILGILLLLMPCLVILFDFSLDYTVYAFTHNESSQSTMGLPHRWIVKSVIPLSMLLMMIAAIARLIGEVVLLMHHGKEPDDDTPPRIQMTARLLRPLLKVDDNPHDKGAG